MGKILMKDIASQLAKKKNIRISEAENYLDAFFAVIHDGLQADKLVKIKGLGTFKLIEVRDRESVDVNTGERVLIDGHTKITFTPENSLKEMVNKPFSQFETVELNDGVEFGSMPNENVETENENTDNKVSESDIITPVDNMSDSGENSIISVDYGIDTHCGAESDIEHEIQSDDAMVEAAHEAANEDESILDNSTDTLGSQNSQSDNTVAQMHADNEAVSRISFKTEDDLSPVSEETPDSETEKEKEPIDNQPLPLAVQADDNANAVGKTFPDSAENVADKREKLQKPLLATDEAEAGNAQGQSQMADTATGIPEGDRRNAHKKTGNLKIVLFSLLALSFIALAFVAGLYLGGKSERSVPASKVVIVKKAFPSKKNGYQKVAVSKAADTIAAKGNIAEKDGIEKKEKTKINDVQDHIPTTENSDIQSAKRMVKTGAYVIEGTDRTVKVKEGQTMKVLARRYLGEGMECYLQVHNGKSEVKVGETINIPKLKLKKKAANNKVS